MQQQNRNSKNKELCKFVQITDMYNVVIQWNLCYMSWFVALFVSDDTTLKPHSLYQWKPPSAGAGLITNWPSTLNVLPACDDWAGRGVDIRQCVCLVRIHSSVNSRQLYDCVKLLFHGIIAFLKHGLNYVWNTVYWPFSHSWTVRLIRCLLEMNDTSELPPTVQTEVKISGMLMLPSLAAIIVCAAVIREWSCGIEAQHNSDISNWFTGQTDVQGFGKSPLATTPLLFPNISSQAPLHLPVFASKELTWPLLNIVTVLNQHVSIEEHLNIHHCERIYLKWQKPYLGKILLMFTFIIITSFLPNPIHDLSCKQPPGGVEIFRWAVNTVESVFELKSKICLTLRAHSWYPHVHWTNM